MNEWGETTLDQSLGAHDFSILCQRHDLNPHPTQDNNTPLCSYGLSTTLSHHQSYLPFFFTICLYLQVYNKPESNNFN